MFCLRSWLPLLFIPTNASPLFVVTFFALTYLLNRPCVYCSLLLLVLFGSSCYWSEQCFLDVHGDWFEPRRLPAALPNPLTSGGGGDGSCGGCGGGGSSDGSSGGPVWGRDEGSVVLAALNETAVTLGGRALEELGRRAAPRGGEWTGLGGQWVRSWLGSREWRVPCVDVKIRL